MRHATKFGLCMVALTFCFKIAVAEQTGATYTQRASAQLGDSSCPTCSRPALDAPISQKINAGNQKSELGVWMTESGGAGVKISRITDGSAAQQAGLRIGDIIIQVNGHGASSPDATANMIRQIPIGQSATLMIWRDGDQRLMQAAMQPVREVRQVGFSGEEQPASGDLSSRTTRLEQQLGTVMQELQQLRQESARLSTAHQSTTPSATGNLPLQTGFQSPDQKAQQSNSKSAEAVRTPSGQNAAAANAFGNELAWKSGATSKAAAESKAGTDSNSSFQ